MEHWHQQDTFLDSTVRLQLLFFLRDVLGSYQISMLLYLFCMFCRDYGRPKLGESTFLEDACQVRTNDLSKRVSKHGCYHASFACCVSSLQIVLLSFHHLATMETVCDPASIILQLEVISKFALHHEV